LDNAHGAAGHDCNTGHAAPIIREQLRKLNIDVVNQMEDGPLRQRPGDLEHGSFNDAPKMETFEP
jgi:hypothetical protein